MESPLPTNQIQTEIRSLSFHASLHVYSNWCVQ